MTGVVMNFTQPVLFVYLVTPGMVGLLFFKSRCGWLTLSDLTKVNQKRR